MHKKLGFTLLEMLLVLTIISTIIVMGLKYTLQKSDELRRDRTALQYQQILNASLAYYLNVSQWPTNITQLTTSPGGYLPNMALNNPWGNPYLVTTVISEEGGTLFYVYSQVPGGSDIYLAQANMIAGRLPMAFVTNTNPPDPESPCTADDEVCYIASNVSVPGQNLNNARSINFSNLYHNGACVPAPECPANMTPSIMAVPTSVSGVNDPGGVYVYPIGSFTAYAYGKANGTTQPDTLPAAPDQVAGCLVPPDTIPAATPCQSTSGTNMPPTPGGNKYWRICLRVITQKGDVAETNTETGALAWGQYANILAITYCEPGNPPSKPVGSDFTVFSR